MNTLQVRQTIYRTLEQQKLHAPLALAGSLYGSLKHRHPVRVQHEDGLWIHRHPDGVVVYRQIYTVTPSQLAEITADIFFHTYTPGPGDVVVDVGAGVGTEVLSLSERVGARGRVVAIEASPSAFETAGPERRQPPRSAGDRCEGPAGVRGSAPEAPPRSVGDTRGMRKQDT